MFCWANKNSNGHRVWLSTRSESKHKATNMSATVLLLLVVSVFLSECSAGATPTIQVDGSGFTEGSGSRGKGVERALSNPSQVCIQPDSNACSSWLWRKNSSTCECGDRLNKIVLCKNDSETIAVIQCYCMNHDHRLGYYVGACLYGCFKPKHHNHNFTKLYSNYSTIESLGSVCSRWYRTGPLCGRCHTNKSIAVYSFSLKCRHCDFHWTNIIRYIAIAYGPLTVFFVILVLFTVSIHSAPLHGYIFVAQMISTSYLMRLLQILNELNTEQQKLQKYSISFAATVYGIWNLDFFRFVNHHYCLHPSFTTLSIISLDYLIAAYPFIIILITYALVLLHGKGCKVLVFLWRPFNWFFARFRENLDIRTSLVDAFGTFFSLSYVKFLSTTVDLMAPTTTQGVDGQHLPTRVFYQGDLIYMKQPHLYYAVTGITFFILFSIIPLVINVLYPRRFFQRRLPLTVKRILHPFMDTLLGIYRDGTDGGMDCRYFVVIYPIARIATFSVLMLVQTSFCFPLVTGVMSITAVLVAVIQPYKSRAYNRVDTILLVNVALIFASLTAFFFADSVSSQQLSFSRVLLIAFISLPFLYACGLTVYKIWTLCKLRRKLVRISKAAVLCCGRVYLYLVKKTQGRQEMEAFPSLSERTVLIAPRHRDLND